MYSACFLLAIYNLRHAFSVTVETALDLIFKDCKWTAFRLMLRPTISGISSKPVTLLSQ